MTSTTCAPERLADSRESAQASREKAILRAVFVALALFQIAQIAHHLTWRDEYQAWLIALESHSLAELMRNMRFEGHPPLWQALLMAAQRVSTDVVVLKVVQAFVSIGALALILFRSPFETSLRALIALNYFIAFEYGVLARPYGLGMLLCLAALALWRSRAAFAPLALMGFVSLHFLLLAALLALLRAKDWRREAAGWGLLCVCAALALYSLWPAPGTVTAVSTRWTATYLWRTVLQDALFLLPVSPIGGWFLRDFYADFIIVSFAVALATPFVLMALTARRSTMRALALLGFASLNLLALFVYPVYPRHAGVLALFLVAAFWIEKEEAPERPTPRAFWIYSLWMGLLGFVASSLALTQDFSSDALAAQWIARDESGRKLLAAYPGWHGLGVTALTGAKTYNVQKGCLDRFQIWDYPAAKLISPTLFTARLAEAASANGGEIFLVTGAPEPPEPPQGVERALLKSFPRDQIEDNPIRLYRYRWREPAKGVALADCPH